MCQVLSGSVYVLYLLRTIQRFGRRIKLYRNIIFIQPFGCLNQFRAYIHLTSQFQDIEINKPAQYQCRYEQPYQKEPHLSVHPDIHQNTPFIPLRRIYPPYTHLYAGRHLSII
jgi:hypothetical protein